MVARSGLCRDGFQLGPRCASAQLGSLTEWIGEGLGDELGAAMRLLSPSLSPMVS